LPDLRIQASTDAIERQSNYETPYRLFSRACGHILRGNLDLAGVVEAWYPGIRGSEAIANLLFDDVNPSGKLPITFPKSEADLPHPDQRCSAQARC
jgi:beta-glucosidase